MNRCIVKGELPRLKPRFGIHPTRVEKNAKAYSRKAKHKNRGGAE